MNQPRITKWLPIAVVTTVGLVIIGAFLPSAYQAYLENFTYYTIDGPQSPEGYSVAIDVHDNSPGISTCFLADVTVRDSYGRIAATWFDNYGQRSAAGVKELANSMRWEDEHTLTFYALDSRRLPRQKVVVKTSPLQNP